MQPPMLADARFIVAGHATQWSMCETNLNNLKPALVVVQADIAPDPDALIHILSRMAAWKGIAVVILPATHRDFKGAFERVDTVRGVYIAPVNWIEIFQAAYGSVITERARLSQTAPMQQTVTSFASASNSASSPAQNASRAFPRRRGRLFHRCRKPGIRACVRMSVKTLLYPWAFRPPPRRISNCTTCLT
jgi:hypothetical protein